MNAVALAVDASSSCSGARVNRQGSTASTGCASAGHGDEPWAPSTHPRRGEAERRLVAGFAHDQFACGRRFRVLNIVDDVTRECLAAIPDTSISGRRVARELTDLIARRGKPNMIVSDHGTEFTSNAILAWSKDRRVEWQLHCAGQAHVKRLRRILQWPNA
jgi:transposase InsO family protein